MKKDITKLGTIALRRACSKVGFSRISETYNSTDSDYSFQWVNKFIGPFSNLTIKEGGWL